MKHSRSRVKRQIAIWWTVIGVLLVIGGMATYGPTDDGGSTLSGALIVGAVIWTGGFWALLIGLRLGRALGHEIRAASTPIPTPAEISVLLEIEWGRPATIQEIAAVHQMLTSRKNEALINTGVGLGALYILNKHVNDL